MRNKKINFWYALLSKGMFNNDIMFLNLYLLGTSADSLELWTQIKLFDTLMVFLKEFFEKFDLEKNQQTQKSVLNYPVGKGLDHIMQFGLVQIVFHFINTAMKE